VRHLVVGIATIVAAAPTAAAAQRFWNTTYLPYAYYRSVDGFWLAGYAMRYSPVGFRQQPEPNRAWISLRAGLSTEGSSVVAGEAQAPAWWDGWRIGVTLLARRDNRLRYFGVGNETVFDDDSTTATSPFFYQLSRSMQRARLTVQRRLVGRLRALAGAVLERTDFRELPGESLFRRHLASGGIDPATVPFTDAVLRAGLVLDSRDHEIDPHRGVLAEALYASGRGYTRTTGAARVWVQPAERLWVAARAAGERMTGDPPLAALLTMETSEEPFAAVGGHRSLRGYDNARFVGPGKLLATVEARYAVIWKPTIFELKVGGFYDVGRVFGPGERFRITKTGLHAGWGGEVGARLQRNTVFVLSTGLGEDGWHLMVDTGWAF
jgi:outer membrane protein assembly factor BamA